jgi:hypothetical protein
VLAKDLWDYVSSGWVQLMNWRLICGSLGLHLISLLMCAYCHVFINVLAKCHMVIFDYKFGVFSTSTRVRYQVLPYAVNSIRSIIPPFILE